MFRQKLLPSSGLTTRNKNTKNMMFRKKLLPSSGLTTRNKNTNNTTFRKKFLPSSGPTTKNKNTKNTTFRKNLLPKRRVFSVFIFGVMMEKVLEEVHEDNENVSSFP
jgi:hypothetical protein